MERKSLFSSDYMEGAHPAVLRRLTETNLVQTPGYGDDEFCRSAGERILTACGCPGGAVYFLVGGTQTNAAVIGTLLKPYQGVIAADTGHISTHEAGAIEHGGHKILVCPSENGKLSADAVQAVINNWTGDENREHMVMPGMVYVSQPTEFGTLYSLAELTAISAVCREAGLHLYLDGARLAYALACPQNDVSLQDIAALCSVFYIGGTKCGALCGEAVVVPEPSLLPHFFTIIKQQGALLAKGRVLGVQFDALFTDSLYETIGTSAILAAQRIRAALRERGYQFYLDSPTNQIFLVVPDEKAHVLAENAGIGFFARYDASHSIVRIVTSWATTDKDVDSLLDIL